MRKFVWFVRLAGFVSLAGFVGCAKAPESLAAPYQSSASLREFMLWYIDPAADGLWDNAGFVVTSEGEEDLKPTDQAGWDAVRNAATVVAEGGNLLMMPGYAVDEEAWIEYAAGVTAAGLAARQAALDKDAEALFEAGANLYSACLACHNRYIIGDTGD